MMIHHLRNLKEGDFAKQVWSEQRRNDWPGLAREVSFICKELGMDDVNVSELTKPALKNEVNKACEDMNSKELKQDMVGFKSNFQNMYKGGNLNCEGCEQVKEMTILLRRLPLTSTKPWS